MNDNIKQSIGQGLKRVRKDRAMTQAQLAEMLAISQPQLSQVESGKGSLTAAQLLHLINHFNLSAADFLPAQKRPEQRDDELQNALARFGALHLREIPDLPASPRYARVDDVILDTLIAPVSPRFVTGLGSVVARNFDFIVFVRLFQRLKDLGREARLLWLLQCLEAATLKRIEDSLPRDKKVFYRQINRGLEGELAVLKNIVETAGMQFHEDILIPRYTGAKALDRLRQARDQNAKNWNILTDIRADDFYRELVETDGYD